MNKTISVITALLFYSVLLSQNINISTSEFDKKDKIIGSLIYTDTSNVRCYDYEGYSNFKLGSYSLQKKEKQLGKEIKFPEYEKKEMIKFSFIELNKKTFLILRYYNKKTDKYSLCATKFDGSGNIDTKLTVLGEIIGDGKKNKGIFNYTVSEDKQRFILYTEDTWEKDKAVQFSLKVFDENLSEIGGAKKYEIPYIGETCEIGNKMLFQNEILYMLATNMESTDPTKVETDRNKVLCINLKENTFKEINIGIQGKTLFDVDFKFDEKGNLVCGGLYSNNSLKENKLFFYGSGHRFANGVFCYLINTNPFNIDKKQIIDLDQEFKGEKYNYYLKDLIVLNNEKVFFVSEQFHYVTITSGSGTSRTSSTTYYYSHILVNHFDFNTEQNWSKRIIKSQSINNTGTLFYSYLPLFKANKDELNLIINTDKEKTPLITGNETEIELEDFRRIKNANTININLNGEGKIKLETLKYGETDYLVECRNSLAVSGASIIVKCMNKDGREAYGFIEYK